MMVRDHGGKPLGLDVGIDLRRGDVRVTKHRLHRAQVSAVGDQVAGKGVAQHVRRQPAPILKRHKGDPE